MTDPPGRPPPPTIAGPLAQIRSARDDMARTLEALDARLAELITRRMEMASAFEQVDVLVDQLERGLAHEDSGADLVYTAPDGTRVVVEAKSSSKPSRAAGPPNVREAILQLLAKEDRAFEASEIVSGVRDLGVDAKPASIRSLLSKMADGGQIDRPKRGLYQRKGAVIDPAAGSGGLIRPSGRFVRQAEIPTPAEFMAMRTDPDEEEPDFDPSDYDPDEHDPSSEDDRSDADYQPMYREEQQARLEDQREETP